MSAEKRQYPRAEISWPVTIISPDSLVSGRTENLSLVGTLIRCSELLELPYSFLLVFNPTGHRIFLAQAERVWFKSFIEESGISHSMGMHFTFITDHDYHLISNAISSHN